MEVYTYGEIPVHMYLKTFKSWYNFQKEMEILSDEQKGYSENTISFLKFLETTSMTKSYKMPLLLSLFDNLKKEVDLKVIGEYFKNFYLDEVHKKDLNNKKHSDLDDKKYQKLAEDNPINILLKREKYRVFYL